MSEDNKQPSSAKGKCRSCKEDVQEGAKKCKHCGADLSNWFVRHKVITAILALFLLGIIGSAMGDTTTETTTFTTSVEETAAEPAAEIEETVPQEWQSVITVSTANEKQTDTFALEGGKQNLIYTVSDSEFGLCSIYVMEEGESLDVDGGFPEVSADGGDSSETLLRKSAGDYYLHIKTANSTCDVEIQELR